LNNTLIIHENVGGLDVSVHNFILMQETTSLDKLFHDGLYFRQCELDFGPEKTCKIMMHILENHKGRSTIQVAFVGFGTDYLLKIDNVRVVELFQKADF
jgi:hypothetical protein